MIQSQKEKSPGYNNYVIYPNIWAIDILLYVKIKFNKMLS